MSKGKIIAYVRVSTLEQNTDRQEKAINDKYNVDKWYIEKISGKNTDRQQLQSMLDYVREDDTIIVSELSRLARNLRDLLNIVNDLEKRQVKLISLKENIDTTTSVGKLMLNMIGAINEFERDIIRERQAEGIAIARQRGKYKGKQSKKIDTRFIELYNKYITRDINKTQFAKEYGISRTTLYKMINEYEQEHKNNNRK